MSADLFAEFGVGSAQQSNRQHPRLRGNSLIPDLETSDDTFSANPWGDLNAFSPQTTQQTLYSSTPAAFNKPNNLQGLGRPSQNHDANVLFDASLDTPANNDDDDDEWGEFESGEALPAQDQSTAHPQGTGQSGNLSRLKSPNVSQSVNLIDSLSIEDPTPPAREASMKTTAGNVRSHTAQSRNISHTPKKPPVEPDESFEDWGEFIDGPPTQPSTEKAPKQPEGGFKNIEPTSSPQVRPTNIPPPSVLLQMFPQLFEQLRQEAMRVKRDLQKTSALESTALQILYTLKSAARVIAGRTLRWKRDTILSQSMKIGPARSGKQGGMKLNTVNKNESIKEQQEALDVLAMWRDRTALFNSVLQAASKQPIPVIAENTRVMTATSEQGALKASHACALCGLKRDERLPKVDEKVEDSFGEWWVDHWGHTDCKQFWETNMSLLGQR